MTATYRMPAEWEPHRRTWLAWPHREADWPGIFDRIPRVWASMARALRDSEEVAIIVSGAAMELDVRRALDGDLGGIRLVTVPTNGAWVRDYGPIFVEAPGAEGRCALTDWGFNSWGGKYPPWDLDDVVPVALGRLLGRPVVSTDMILEGGSIDVDGEGTLLTTESCLLNPNRNPRLSREAIEARLERHLGATKVLWLGRGIAGDDTDGHVDDLTRFVGPGRVVTAVDDDPASPNLAPLAENRDRLASLRDARGRRLEVIELPVPPVVRHEGQVCPASYANFYIGNGAVLVPTFRSDRDARVLGILGELFPERRVVGIDCTDMVWGLGAIHCVTQQEPELSAG